MKIKKTFDVETFNEYLNSPVYSTLLQKITELGDKVFHANRLANLQAYFEGFTFYTSSKYRPTPVDILPRIISIKDFRLVENSLKARAKILNAFLREVYEEGNVPIPEWIVKESPYYKPEMIGFSPPQGIYIHVYGADLVRVNGRFYILEDNLRIPSGVAYAYKVREFAERFLPELGEGYKKLELDAIENLSKITSCGMKNPVKVILTDGSLNSAFFEHSFISKNCDMILAEPKDLRVKEGEVVVNTADCGEVHVDIIYRRIEDLEVLSPEILRAYLRGWVTIANAPGTGIADDKAIFPFIPYLAERYSISLGDVYQPYTMDLYDLENLSRFIENPNGFVIKRREGYGGFGLSIIKDEKNDSVLEEVAKSHENFIAQQTLDFDTTVSVLGDEYYESFSDLRFFTYFDNVSKAVLSRVAPPGSRVTNNSSGGMVKPVWIIQ
ncbi:circularly permuted type 2 ATP-grasp protein [Acidianus sp. RZ1]|uniref:circularly permuted type 2 ATP-grasp protein n=1 Tax=Acidianus sp. RZ1 TaxID=1540082 RepID=UPI0035300263